MKDYECFMRRQAVLEMTGMTQTALYRAIHTDGFPPPIKIAARQIAFSKCDVLAWMQAKKKAAYADFGTGMPHITSAKSKGA